MNIRKVGATGSYPSTIRSWVADWRKSAVPDYFDSIRFDAVLGGRQYRTRDSWYR